MRHVGTFERRPGNRIAYDIILPDSSIVGSVELGDDDRWHEIGGDRVWAQMSDAARAMGVR